MYRARLRPAPDLEEMNQLYPHPHDHTQYGWDHHIRVEHTITLGKWMANSFLPDHHGRKVRAIADLSTGNAAIPKGIGESMRPTPKLILGDFAVCYEHQGPIEETVHQLQDDSVDLFVCSETIEHIDNPESVLAAIAEKSFGLLLSTPIGENNDGNREHLWGWDQESVKDMLAKSGWNPFCHVDLMLPDWYNYQIWASIRA